MQLLITEKPSVAQDIARVLGINQKGQGYFYNNDYYITWAFGHLVTLCMPDEQDEKWKHEDGKWRIEDLPILPEHYKYKVISGVQQQFNVIKNLIHNENVEEIINCGDDGREGEYIQRLIYSKAGNTKPVLRLRISSMNDEAIIDGFNNLVDSSVMDGIYMSARCRAISDYKIGINFSRLVNLKNNTYGFSVGRVQTPAVALVRNRNDEIANFVVKPFYQVEAFFDRDYSGTLINQDGTIVRFDNQMDADMVISEIKSQLAVITTYKTERKETQRPKLYNLSDLQIEANKRYSLTGKQVLDICQSLYETHKITTYPRTDSNCLNESMMSDMPQIIDDIISKCGKNLSNTAVGQGRLTFDKHIFNNKKVSDHHAIIINSNYKKFNLNELSENERKILDLITNRILLAFSPKYEYDQTTVITEVKDYTFRSKGVTPITMGWKDMLLALGEKVPTSKEESVVFNGLFQNLSVACYKGERQDKKTTPPKQLTEGDLIKLMVNVGSTITEEMLANAQTEEDLEFLKKAINSAEGIGTEATRADIIKEIKDKGYIKVEKKFLYITDKGRTLLDIAPSRLTNPIMSAEWESAFKKIEKGELDYKEFDKEIDQYIIETIDNYKGTSIGNPDVEVVGTCPKCKSDMQTGKYGIYCKGKCGFTFTKFRGKELTEKQKIALLQRKAVLVRGLKPSDEKKSPYDICIKPKAIRSFEYNGKTYYAFDYATAFPKSKK